MVMTLCLHYVDIAFISQKRICIHTCYVWEIRMRRAAFTERTWIWMANKCTRGVVGLVSNVAISWRFKFVIVCMSMPSRECTFKYLMYVSLLTIYGKETWINICVCVCLPSRQREMLLVINKYACPCSSQPRFLLCPFRHSNSKYIYIYFTFFVPFSHMIFGSIERRNHSKYTFYNISYLPIIPSSPKILTCNKW